MQVEFAGKIIELNERLSIAVFAYRMLKIAVTCKCFQSTNMTGKLNSHTTYPLVKYQLAIPSGKVTAYF